MKKAYVVIISVLLSALPNAIVCANEEARIIDLGPIVITASRIAQHDYKVASNVTVINQQDIETSSAKNIPDILMHTVGINIYNTSNEKSSTIDIRGFGETATRNILVLVNDRKINSADITGPDLLQIPIEAVERIEIIRGAGSVLYGDNAVGGVVNIITKKGKGDLTGYIGATYGSYRTRGIDMEISGSKKFNFLDMDNKVSYYLYSQYHDTEGYRGNSDILTKDYNARLGYTFSDTLSVDLDFGWHEDDYGLPSGLTDTALQQKGRKGTSAPEDSAATRDRYVNLSLDLNPWPEDAYFGDFIVDFFYRNRDTYADFVSLGSDTKNSIDTFGITSKYIFDRTLFNRDINFVTGIDYYDNENDIIGAGTFPADITIAKKEFGLYGYLEYECLDNIFVNGGTRYITADYTFDHRNAASYETENPSEWVSMAGAKYEYSKGSNIYFNIQQTFRFLATDEWYDSFNGVLNTDLSQQTGIQYEAGIKHNLSNTLTAHLTYYWIDNKNEIYYDPKGGPFGWGANANYDTTRRVGIETGQTTDLKKFFKIDILDTLELLTAYSYQTAKFLGGQYDNKTIPLVPHHQATSGLSIGFLENFNVSILGTYVSSRFAISDVENISAPIKPHHILDGKISYAHKNLELYAALDNITNEKYYSAVTYISGFGNYYYPAPERSYTIGVKGKF